MASLNLDLNYFEHPKVMRLVGRLGKGAEVLPIRLWCYVGKWHAEDGKLTGYSATEIETHVSWWGKPGAAVEALTKEGSLFLDIIENGFQVHDWLDWARHIHALRTHAKEMNKKRWAPKESTVQHPAQYPTQHPVQESQQKIVGNAGSDPLVSEGSESEEVFDPGKLPMQTVEGRDLLKRLRAAIASTLIWAEDIAKHPSTQNKILARVNRFGESSYTQALKTAYTETGDRSIAQLLKAADRKLDGKKTENFSEEKYAKSANPDGSF